MVGWILSLPAFFQELPLCLSGDVPCSLVCNTETHYPFSDHSCWGYGQTSDPTIFFPDITTTSSKTIAFHWSLEIGILCSPGLWGRHFPAMHLVKQVKQLKQVRRGQGNTENTGVRD